MVFEKIEIQKVVEQRDDNKRECLSIIHMNLWNRLSKNYSNVVV
jgi:hypothetical protein